MEDKQALRTAMYAQRGRMSDEEAEYLSGLAQERLMREKIWAKSRIVALYSPIRKEAQAGGLMRAAWAEGKQVLLPRTIPGPNRLIQFLPCESFDTLKPGVFGILEPDPLTCPLPPEGEIIPDLMVVPGVAYDRNGYRLGNGGGYYDRFFARPGMDSVARLGFAYDFQVVDAIPDLGPWDVPMHGYCTDKDCVWLKNV